MLIPLGVCVLLLATVAGIAVPIMQRLTGEVNALQSAAREAQAQSIASSIDRYFDNRLTLLRDHAWHPALLQLLINPDATTMDALDAMHQMTMIGQRYSLALYTTDGSRRCTTDGGATPASIESLIPKPTADLPSVVRAVQLDDGWYWILAVPVNNLGESFGTLAAFAPVEKTLHSAGFRLPEETLVTLRFDGNTLAEHGEHTCDVVNVNADLSIPGASVMVGTTPSSVDQAGARIARGFVAAMLVMIPLALVLWVCFTKVALVIPLRRLITRIDAVERGEDAAAMLQMTRFSETAKL